MKKNQFSGVDRLVVEKFAAPIEKFNTNEDFQIWCKERLHNYSDKDFFSDDFQITAARNQILEDWRKSVFNVPEKIRSMPILKILGGSFNTISSNIEFLPSLQEVSGDAYF